MADAAQTVANAVDGDSLITLLRDAIRIPSITLGEGDFARWVHNQLDTWDTVRLADISPGRPNVYGSVGGEGRSLVLAGHLDTVHVDDWVEHWEGTERANPYEAQIIDGEIWGRGVTDQKAGVVAIIEALRAIHRAGYRPKGTVTGLFVCDEESGIPGSGISAGMRAAVADPSSGLGDQAFAIYTEPTTSAIYTAQMGFLIADITLTGLSAYFGTPELGVDALKAGHTLLDRLWAHSDELRTTASHELLGEPFLLVTSVRSGGNIAVPGQFDLSLIRKILPGEDLNAAADAVTEIAEHVATEHHVEANIVFSAPRDHAVGGTPDEVAADHPGVVELSRSISTTTGAAARIEGAPYWSEKPFLRALGIPGVYFAPGDIATCHTPFERIATDELISATRTLAHFVASWCGLEPIDSQPTLEEK